VLSHRSTGQSRHTIWEGRTHNLLRKPHESRSEQTNKISSLQYSEIYRMIELGVIEKSNSAWSSPMRMVAKTGKVRLCLENKWKH